mgnify:CR=1 FL=1
MAGQILAPAVPSSSVLRVGVVIALADKAKVAKRG